MQVVNEDAKKVEEYRVLNKSLRQSFSANRQRPVDFFELVVDKQSYPTTVENIFNFAFLIREDMAKLNISNDGMPKVEPVVEDREEGRRKKNEQESNQMIFHWITKSGR
ncbi:non-structural maintenance of chromosomes element 4 homolog A-like [Nilaparvata lugens]|uniref:non-structural maintenance of chromosomes element 4 homolog A-like n=1 Tax=Nilaparvata lugens TaxID=108931 RepID=UPI00193CB87C|nr:non-structural maintenance of chromosomes element 4 homolog A-like [Nilaparvata lugens]